MRKVWPSERWPEVRPQESIPAECRRGSELLGLQSAIYAGKELRPTVREICQKVGSASEEVANLHQGIGCGFQGFAIHFLGEGWVKKSRMAWIVQLCGLGG